MSREIKFRVWDKDFKEFSNWTNRDPFFDMSRNQIFFWERTQKEDGSFGGDIILQDNSYRFVIQQFTGLKDKNGKEIYEGDIITQWYPEREVGEEYGPDLLSIVCFGSYDASSMFGGNESYIGFYLDGHNPDSQSDFFMCPSAYHVVGNIFENPELLK